MNFFKKYRAPKFNKFPSSVGIVPENWLSIIFMFLIKLIDVQNYIFFYSSFKFVKLPNSSGIGSEN